jgi:hypothetical protein
MRVEQFAMERMQSTYENQVAFNLSESGVRPLTARELLEEPAALDGLLDQLLVYTQSNGTAELRTLVAGLYPGATLEAVEVTNGGSEANFVAMWRLIEPGDEVVMMVPNYMQTCGLIRAFGGTVREWPLVEDHAAGRWRPDLDHLHGLVSPRTRAIVICNPNNPTGARLREDELNEIASVARAHGAWILSDEIYRGAELDGQLTPSMWGRSDRVLVTGGLSKAYGLPGLRIGWIVGPPDTVASLWSYHDYTTIAPGALSDRLACAALAPSRRARLLERTRGILCGNLPEIERWLSSRRLSSGAPAFTWIRPEAGAIVYVRYHQRINSTHLVTDLRQRHSVLVVPGDHFGMDGYLRLGYGDAPSYMLEGLSRLARLLDVVPEPAPSAMTT